MLEAVSLAAAGRPFLLGPRLVAPQSNRGLRVVRPAEAERLHRLFGTIRTKSAPPAPWMRRPAPAVSLEMRGERMDATTTTTITTPVSLSRTGVLVIPEFEDYELPCGLRRSEMFQLMLRDLTPEDYDTLLRLDERNAKKTAAEKVAEISSKSAHGKTGSCGVCLGAFHEDTNLQIKTLKCGHVFHADCIDRWLKNYADRCPIDNQSLDSQ